MGSGQGLPYLRQGYCMTDNTDEMRVDFLLAFLAPICDPANAAKWRKNFEDKHKPKEPSNG